MTNFSNGGSFVPAADYNTTGNWSFAGAVTNSGTATTTSNRGTPAASTVTAIEKGNGVFHQTTLTITALAVSLSDANVGGGTKIYTFPEGNITVLAGLATIAETTTSTILTTLNGGSTLSVGVGSVQTVAQASGTLATTEQDVVNQFSVTSSTVINVAGAAASGKISATTLLRYDGTTTAQPLYLNIGIPTATDIDADATCTVSGTVVLTWTHDGDY